MRLIFNVIDVCKIKISVVICIKLCINSFKKKCSVEILIHIPCLCAYLCAFIMTFVNIYVTPSLVITFI